MADLPLISTDLVLIAGAVNTFHWRWKPGGQYANLTGWTGTALARDDFAAGTVWFNGTQATILSIDASGNVVLTVDLSDGALVGPKRGVYQINLIDPDGASTPFAKGVARLIPRVTAA